MMYILRCGVLEVSRTLNHLKPLLQILWHIQAWERKSNLAICDLQDLYWSREKSIL